MLKLFKLYLPPIFWAGFIFWNSAQPHHKVPKFYFPHIDKVAHFVVYFILGYLITRLLCQGNIKKLSRGIIIWAIVIGSLYGISDEFHQYFVPGRSTDVFDWIADTFGVISAQGAILYLSRRFEKFFRHIF